MPLDDARIRSNYNEINNLLVGGWTHVSVCTPITKECSEGYASDSTLRFFQLPNFHYFEDYVNKRIRGTRRYPPAPCVHVSSEFPILPYANSFYSQSQGLVYNFVGDPYVYLPIGPDELRTTYFVVDSRGWLSDFDVSDSTRSDLCEQAFNYFSTVFPEELSLGEFAQGFTQLKELLPKVKDSILSTLSSGFLTKEFGWDNLLSDLGTCNRLFDDCARRLEYLRDTWGIPTRLGFVRNGIHQLPHSNDYYTMFSPVFADWPCGGRLTLVNYNYQFRATCWITQTLDFIDGIQGWIRVVTAALGLNNPIKQFWNLLPFSFVVDWFLNVSQHLDNLTRVQPAIGWDIGSVTNSVKAEFTWRASQIADQYTSFDREIKGVDFTVTRYVRDLGLPFHWELLDPDGLSEHQQLLLVALFL